MKTTKSSLRTSLFRIATALVGLLLVAEIGTANTRADCPVGLPASVQYTVAAFNPIFDSEITYSKVIINDGSALQGTYAAWCAVQSNPYLPFGQPLTSATFCSSTALSGIVQQPINLDLVNWILNQHFTTAAGGGYDPLAVQHAIWLLLDTSYVDSNISQAIKDQRDTIKALAVANGRGFEPKCGQLAGVLLPGKDSLDQPVQPLLIGVPISCLGDLVWVDSNLDGKQDGESGLGGVQVLLFDCTGNLLAQTTTDSLGLYHFAVLAGSYKIQFQLPGGFRFTTLGPAAGADVNDSDANTSDGTTECITVGSGQVDDSWDAGLVRLTIPQDEPPYATIGDRVWVDANANGVQDDGEIGKANVLVELYDCSGNYLSQTMTDGNGFYRFYVAPGSYSLAFSLPDGYGFTAQGPLGVRDEADSDADTTSGQTECVPVAANQIDLTWDAGLVPLGSIGDRFWEDLNGNGTQDDNEPGVSGAAVELRRCSDYSLFASTTTGASGYYLFPNLPAGDYYVVFAKPDGFSFTTYKVGSDDTSDSDADVATGATACVTLGWGESNLNVDAGLVGGPLVSGDTATIGYWQNKNGQALIKSLNGGPNSTALANWLASDYPYLYGPYSPNDLTDKSNADVAALFVRFFKVKGAKTDAQILAVALAVYVTDSALAGNAAVSAGFNVSAATGTGFRMFNVGSCGTAVGLDNNTTYSVGYLLWVANFQKQNGTFNANAFNCIFDGINQAGDRI